MTIEEVVVGCCILAFIHIFLFFLLCCYEGVWALGIIFMLICCVSLPIVISVTGLEIPPMSKIEIFRIGLFVVTIFITENVFYLSCMRI